jgi:hypothetical protein
MLSVETMRVSEETKQLPSDDELAEMLARAEGKGKGRKARDQNLPSPRFPEAVYYYLFILVEAAVLMGVWGFMRMGIEEAMRGPTIEAPVMDQVVFQVKSIGVGFVNVLQTQPWLPILAAVLAAPVFMPKTPKSRKRMATILSTLLVGVFVALIAAQFSEDMAGAASMNQF